MKRRPLPFYAVVIAGAEIVAIGTAMATAPAFAVLVIAAALISVDVAVLRILDQLEAAVRRVDAYERKAAG